MKLFRNLAKSLYEAVVPEAERQATALTTISDTQRAQLAITFFGREAALLERSDQTYQRAHRAAEDFIVSHHYEGSIRQVHRKEFTRTAEDDYVQAMVLGNLLSKDDAVDLAATPVSLSNQLFGKIEEDVKAARLEKSFIKRRSIIRNAIKREVPSLNSDDLTLAVELVIAIKR